MREFPLYTFISTGDKVAMYTLRMMVEVATMNGTYKRDDFVRILSNDKDKANALAQQLSDDYGIPFKSDASFDLNEIKRRKSEEVEAERIERENDERLRIEIIEREFQNDVKIGTFVVGKYTGMTPEEVHKIDVGYLFWLASLKNENESKSKIDVNIQIAVNYIEQNNLVAAGHVGNDGETVQVKVKLVSSHVKQGQYKTIRFNCQGENGEFVAFNSVAKAFTELKSGDIIEVIGRASHLTTYDGKAMTFLNKPKIVKK